MMLVLSHPSNYHASNLSPTAMGRLGGDLNPVRLLVWFHLSNGIQESSLTRGQLGQL